MGTRSRIGIELSDGSVLSVYCHWDGYPEFNGVKLKEHFNSFQKAAALIDGGDVSSLWTDKGWDQQGLPEEGTLYYADRGEFYEPRYDMSLATYLANGEEFAYVYTQSEGWLCYNSAMEGVAIPVAIPAPVAA